MDNALLATEDIRRQGGVPVEISPPLPPAPPSPPGRRSAGVWKAATPFPPPGTLPHPLENASRFPQPAGHGGELSLPFRNRKSYTSDINHPAGVAHFLTVALAQFPSVASKRVILGAENVVSDLRVIDLKTLRNVSKLSLSGVELNALEQAVTERMQKGERPCG